MILRNSDTRLARVVFEVCDALESVDELRDQTLTIEVVPSFSEQPIEALRNTPAGYVDAERKILINAKVFFEASSEAWAGILAHEIGEFVALHHPRLVQPAAALVPDLRADFFACVAGFHQSLRLGRTERHVSYLSALDAWRTPDQFVSKMIVWRNQKLARILPGAG